MMTEPQPELFACEFLLLEWCGCVKQNHGGIMVRQEEAVKLGFEDLNIISGFIGSNIVSFVCCVCGFI